MNFKKKITVLLIAIMIPILMGASYNYSFHGEVLHSSPGYNYISHFDQQILDYPYSDPMDFKVYNDHIYLLAKDQDKTKDLLIILNSNYEIVEVLDEFELTEDYKKKVSLKVDDTFEMIKNLYESIFDEKNIYPGITLPFSQIGEIIETIKFEWRSSDTNIIGDDGFVSYTGDEETSVDVELSLELLDSITVFNFTIKVVPAFEGITGVKNNGISYVVEENVYIESINSIIGTNIDHFIYNDVSEFLDDKIDVSVLKDEVYTLEFDNFIVKFENDYEEDKKYKNINFTEKLEDADFSDIHGTLFDEIYTTNKAEGLEVVDSGIYIADTNNNRIIKLNHNFEVVDGFFGVEDEIFKNHVYRPIKITVDTSERMYVVASGVYEGILELDSNGDFNRYTGVNPIQLSPFEIFKRLLMTESQKSKLERFLPTDYTSVTITEKSFIYATAKPRDGNAKNMIQLINPKGVDVLKRNGYNPPMGDIMYVSGLNNYVIDGPSNLIDIAIGENGIYSVLDAKRSRIFTYDDEGNLLYVNGDKGFQSDKFSQGVAINYFGENLVVLDGSGTMIVYRPTEFGESVNNAVRHHKNGNFVEAAKEWENVLRINTNYEVAYNGIGKYNLREGNYKEAMKNFKLGHDQYYYSKAFKEQRNIFIRKNFTLIVVGLTVIIGSIIGVKKYIEFKGRES